MTPRPESVAEAVLRVQESGAAVAAARTDEALAFLRFRISSSTDAKAKAQAIVETKSQLDIALAEWEAAKAYLAVAVAEVAREGTSAVKP